MDQEAILSINVEKIFSLNEENKHSLERNRSKSQLQATLDGIR